MLITESKEGATTIAASKGSLKGKVSIMQELNKSDVPK